MTNGKKFIVLLLCIICFISCLFCASAQSEAKFIEVSSDASSASAVLAKYEGSVYVICTQSALFGFDRLVINSKSGDSYKPIKFEIADDRDLARITIDGKPETAFEINFDVQPDMPVAIFSESDKKENCKIQNSGVWTLSLSIPQNKEKSGLPIIDNDGRLVGFSTSIPPAIDENEIHEGRIVLRQFQNQIGVKFKKNAKWIKFDWKSYSASTKTLANAKNSLIKYVVLTNVWSKSPYNAITLDENPTSEIAKWIERHNNTVKNYPKYLTKIVNDRNPNTNDQTNQQMPDGRKIVKFNKKSDDPDTNAALIQKLQKAISADAVGLNSYPSVMIKNLNNQTLPSDFLNDYTAKYNSLYTRISDLITCKSKALIYLDPTSF